MIKGKFSTLVTKSCKKLQNRKIDVDDVQMFLVTMYSSPDSKDGSDMVAAVVESARSLDEIFCALSKHRLWDYLNYYLLQSIIEEFANDDDELKRMMKQYQRDLTVSVLTLRIQEYLEATHSLATSDSDNLADESVPLQQNHKLFTKLTVKLNGNPFDTVSYVIDVQRTIAKHLALPQHAMILHDIAKGCICITWFIPANLGKLVTTMVQEATNIFAEENVPRVSLETKLLQPESEPSLLETEAAAYKRKVCCCL